MASSMATSATSIKTGCTPTDSRQQSELIKMSCHRDRGASSICCLEYAKFGGGVKVFLYLVESVICFPHMRTLPYSVAPQCTYLSGISDIKLPPMLNARNVERLEISVILVSLFWANWNSSMLSSPSICCLGMNVISLFVSNNLFRRVQLLRWGKKPSLLLLTKSTISRGRRLNAFSWIALILWPAKDTQNTNGVSDDISGNPVDTRRNNNVIMTSKRRCAVVLTS